LSTTYRTITGDTFEIIARKKYGTEVEALRIAQANPGVVEPFTVGIDIVIPVLPEAPLNTPQQAPAGDHDEVALLIDGQRFRFWEKVRITRAIDKMDIVEFSAPFDADAPGFKETFVPFSYKRIEITVGGTPLFTGTMVSVNPEVASERKILTVGGYSLPGVLNDCTAPASSFPLEFNNQKLNDIASTMAKPFGIGVEFNANPGAVFDRVAAEPGRRVLAFLTELAKQRNLIISSSTRGSLLFPAIVKAGSPVAKLKQGESPVLSVLPFFSPQEYYSHVTGIEPVIVGLAGSQFTVKNPRLKGVIRPITFNAPDTIGADVKSAVEAKAGRMFGSAAAYNVTVASWRDPLGNLWAPNTTVTLQAKDGMIYNDYEFMIRSVEFNRDRNTSTATLNLVIPGSFRGQIPKRLPWDE
jgi:prophage tail gpP-like protein/phage tail protein X